MTVLYSATLLVARPRKIPPELTSWSMEEKITQEMEAMFQILWMAPSTNPT